MWLLRSSVGLPATVLRSPVGIPAAFSAVTFRHRWAVGPLGIRHASSDLGNCVVLQNSVPYLRGEWRGTSKQLLAQLPRGAYTTARTVGGGSAVLEFETHVNRTAESLRTIVYDTQPAAVAVELEQRLDHALMSGELAQKFMEHFTLAVRGLQQQQPWEQEEYRLTTLVSWAATDLYTRTDRDGGPGSPFFGMDIYCHASVLPPPPAPPVVVEVRGSARTDATAKDSAWVTQRQGLEELRGEGVDEIILSDSLDGSLLEGSQTNFYAVSSSGVLLTAGAGVLEGTVRKIVLEICAREGIPTELSAPVLPTGENDESDDAGWQGCLISSTSRLLLPVDTIRVCREGERWDASVDRCVSFRNGENGLARRLATMVAAEVCAHSTPLQ